MKYAMVPGFPGYRAGNDGRVQSSRNSAGEWRDLSPRLSSKGYLRVALRKDGRTYDRKIHQLILEAFVGPCPSGMEACHAPDPDRTNNRLENLRWDTRKANTADALALGRFSAGERHHSAKLTDAERMTVRQLLADGFAVSSIAREFKVDPKAIRKIRQRSL